MFILTLSTHFPWDVENLHLSSLYLKTVYLSHLREPLKCLVKQIYLHGIANSRNNNVLPRYV